VSYVIDCRVNVTEFYFLLQLLKFPTASLPTKLQKLFGIICLTVRIVHYFCASLMRNLSPDCTGSWISNRTTLRLRSCPGDLISILCTLKMSPFEATQMSSAQCDHRKLLATHRDALTGGHKEMYTRKIAKIGLRNWRRIC